MNLKAFKKVILFFATCFATTILVESKIQNNSEIRCQIFSYEEAKPETKMLSNSEIAETDSSTTVVDVDNNNELDPNKEESSPERNNSLAENFFFSKEDKFSLKTLSSLIKNEIISIDNKPERSYLIIGEKGAGKKTFLKGLAKELKGTLICIDCASFLSLLSPEESATNCNNTLSEIIVRFGLGKMSPTFIALDNLEALPAKNKSIMAHQTIDIIISKINRLNTTRFFKYTNENNESVCWEQNCFIFGLAGKANGICQELRNSFDGREVEIRGLDKSSRLEFIEDQVQEIVNKHDYIKISSETINELNNKLPFLTYSKIKHLLKATTFNAIKSSSQEIKYLDFEKNLKYLSSSSNLKAKVIDLGWKDKFTGQKNPFSVNLYPPESINFGWEDMIIEEGAKDFINTQVIESLNNTNLKPGVSQSKGLLLYGPPGTGKTLLPRLITAATNSALITVEAPTLISKYIGDSANNVSMLFKCARNIALQYKTKCIVFIDEFDAVGVKRSMGEGALHDSLRQVVNQLLAEIDGFSELEDVFIIVSTNREELLDEALLRGGRIELALKLDKPSYSQILKYFELLKKQYSFDPILNFNSIIPLLSSYSFADIKSIVNNAATNACIKNKDFIDYNDLIESFLNKSIGTINDPEKKPDEYLLRVAYHEAGHALFHVETKGKGKLNDKCSPLLAVTTVGRGSAGGITFSAWENDRKLETKAELWNRVLSALGGYTAEKIIFGAENVSRGASSDFQQATKLIQSMICNYGMTDLGLTYSDVKNAEKDPKIMKKTRELINQAEKETLAFLKKYEEYLNWIALKLVKVKKMTGPQLNEFLSECEEKKALGQEIVFTE